MKQIYVCEKCGAQYDNYDAAYKCENEHYFLRTEDFYPEICEHSKYAIGEKLPTRVFLPSIEISEYDEDAGEWKYSYLWGEYKLVKQLPEKDCEKFIQAKTEREEKSRREWEEYMARREAEKKAKEEAEKEAE